MAARKAKVYLVHKTYQEVRIVDGYVTDSGNRVLVCETANAKKTLLADEQYWTSNPEEVNEVFKSFSTEHLKAVKAALAKEHRAAAQSSKKNFVSAERRASSARIDEQEIEELNFETSTIERRSNGHDVGTDRPGRSSDVLAASNW